MLLDEATPEGHAATEAICTHMCLDDRQVPRVDSNGETFSLWGRVCEYMKRNDRQD